MSENFKNVNREKLQMPDLTCGIAKALRQWFVRQEPLVSPVQPSQQTTYSMQRDNQAQIWSGTVGNYLCLVLELENDVMLQTHEGLLRVTRLRCLFLNSLEIAPDDINSSSTPYNTVDDELEWDDSPDNYRLGKSGESSFIIASGQTKCPSRAPSVNLSS